MELTDSRRLTGANLLMDGPGAAAEAIIADELKDAVIAKWRAHMRTILDAVDWHSEEMFIRRYQGGATLAISAPIDALYAATDLIEAAWDAIDDGLETETIAKLINLIAGERDPKLLALAAKAEAENVTMLSDDDWVSLGLGRHSQSWQRGEIPAPNYVKWQNIRDVPVALVTGTNGKSTTVRIAAAIGAAAGQTVGFSSSDWVRAGSEIIAKGDYSGPEGARLALRDHRVDMAIIETARGGLLRRGLPIARADACLITNVASDHLGEYGIKDVPALADVKFLLAKAVKSSGLLILNADDPYLVERSQSFHGELMWYGLSINEASLKEWIESGKPAAFIRGDMMVLARDGKIMPIMPVNDFGPGLGGAALYNISNALGAIALTSALGIKPAAITKGLAGFESSPEHNPGRGNIMDIGGVKTMIDFAHNPHGISALVSAVKNIPAKRRLFLLGQAGDRSDANIRAMTRAVHAGNPARIIIKELPGYLRGRKLGEVPTIIKDELDRLGYPDAQTQKTSSELEAVKAALSWAQSGDLLVFLVYEQRSEVLDLIKQLKAENWQPGQSVDPG